MKIMKYALMSYSEFLTIFPNEKDVIDLICEVKTIYCSGCEDSKNVVRSTRNFKNIYCPKCRMESSILRDTMFSKAHLDLRKWLYIIYIDRFFCEYGVKEMVDERITDRLGPYH